MDYEESAQFARDLKKLLKRFRTLEEDLERAKRFAIEIFHADPRVDTNAIEQIPGFCTDEILVCKIRKFACGALKGRGAMSGIRIIYVYHVSARKVVFIEMYFKGDKENEDQEVLKDYLRKHGA